MDTRELVSALRTRLLRGLASAHGTHFQGLSAAARASPDLSPKLRNKMIKIDFAYHLCEHITQQSIADFIVEVFGSEQSSEHDFLIGPSVAAPRYRPRPPAAGLDPTAIDFVPQTLSWNGSARPSAQPASHQATWSVPEALASAQTVYDSQLLAYSNLVADQNHTIAKLQGTLDKLGEAPHATVSSEECAAAPAKVVPCGTEDVSAESSPSAASSGSDAVWDEIDIVRDGIEGVKAQLDDLACRFDGRLKATVTELSNFVVKTVREAVPAALKAQNVPILNTLDLLTTQLADPLQKLDVLQTQVAELDALVKGTRRMAPAAAGPRPSDDSTADLVCKYGRRCHRLDCVFLHPEGRLIEDTQETARPAPAPRERGVPRAASAEAPRHASGGPTKMEPPTSPIDYGRFEDIVLEDAMEEFLTMRGPSPAEWPGGHMLSSLPPEPDVD